MLHRRLLLLLLECELLQLQLQLLQLRKDTRRPEHCDTLPHALSLQERQDVCEGTAQLVHRSAGSSVRGRWACTGRAGGCPLSGSPCAGAMFQDPRLSWGKALLREWQVGAEIGAERQEVGMVGCCPDVVRQQVSCRGAEHSVGAGTAGQQGGRTLPEERRLSEELPNLDLKQTAHLQARLRGEDQHRETHCRCGWGWVACRLHLWLCCCGGAGSRRRPSGCMRCLGHAVRLL